MNAGVFICLALVTATAGIIFSGSVLYFLIKGRTED